MPSVMLPWMASQPPRASTPTWPRVGTASSAGLNRAIMRASRTPGRVQVRARALHALQFLVFLPEALDHADPADGLVDDGRDLARLLLRVPARREQLAPGPQRDHPQRRGDRQRHHGQQRRQGQHDDDRDDEEQRAADGDRQERQQRPGSC